MKQTKFARNIWLGVENLLLHKLRSFLTMLGVVFGVGSVVAMLAVGEGASEKAMADIRRLGSNNIIITSMKPAEQEQTAVSRNSMSVYGLTYEDHRRMAASLKQVKKAAPVKIIRKEARLREQSMELRVVGTTAEWFGLVPREILAGRVLTDYDEQKRAPVAILTEFGARKLLATAEHHRSDRPPRGQRIRGHRHRQAARAARPATSRSPTRRPTSYISLEVARRYYGDIFARMTSGSFERERVELHQIIVQVDDPKHVEAAAAGIERMLGLFHPKKDFVVSVPLALLKQAEATKRTFNIVLGSIAGISLLVGGIGIMNIMLASVTERTREIGIRRAIGAKRRQIIYQFLIETVVLSTFGGLIGLGIGVLIPRLITHFSNMPTVVTLNGILLPLFISMSIGILFGLYPAIHAAKVDPIVALRHE